MLNSTEHEISTVRDTLLLKNKKKRLLFFKYSAAVLMLLTPRMQIIVGLLAFMSMINFVLSRVEHEKPRGMSSRQSFKQRTAYPASIVFFYNKSTIWNTLYE